MYCLYLLYVMYTAVFVYKSEVACVSVSVLILQVYNVNPVPSQLGSR